MKVSSAIVAVLALFSIGPALADANVKAIRIAGHDQFVRVVIDLDAPVTFTAQSGNVFEIEGLAGGGTAMNADASAAPLKRVLISPDGTAEKLSFETMAPVKAEAFALAPNSDGGNRLVVDLYKEPQAAASTQDLPAPSPVSTSAAQPSPAPLAASASLASQSAVPAVAPLPIQQSAAAGITQAVPPNDAGPPISTANEAPLVATQADAEPATPLISDAMADPPEMTPDAAFEADGAAKPAATAPNVDAQAIEAEQALDRDDPKAACAEANQVLASDAHNMRALAVQGSCDLALGDAQGAASAFKSALDIDPSFHRARLGMAAAEAELGNIPAARADYQRVLADNPPTEDVYRIISALKSVKSSDAMVSSAPAIN